jgi:hypothetical protein
MSFLYMYLLFESSHRAQEISVVANSCTLYLGQDWPTAANIPKVIATPENAVERRDEQVASFSIYY